MMALSSRHLATAEKAGSICQSAAPYSMASLVEFLDLKDQGLQWLNQTAVETVRAPDQNRADWGSVTELGDETLLLIHLMLMMAPAAGGQGGDDGGQGGRAIAGRRGPHHLHRGHLPRALS